MNSGSGRGVFWKNVVKRINFHNDDERRQIIKLTDDGDGGCQWSVPESFGRIHRHVYHEIAEPVNKYTEHVERDVPRTYVLFELPHDTTAMEPALRRVLNAISEAEDGYCQGMNFIAAVFLVEGMSEEDAYITYLYLLKHKYLSQFYKDSSVFLNEYLLQFHAQFAALLPELASRLDACGFSVYLYGVEWFTTIFSCSSKMDLCHAVLDMILVDVQDVMFRVGLALLKNVESQLMDLQFEDLLHQFKHIVKQADTYQVVMDALAMPTFGGMLAKTARRTFNPDGSWPFIRHRTLGPAMSRACEDGRFSAQQWTDWAATASPEASAVVANEILHYAVWYGHVHLVTLAIDTCKVDVNASDDFALRPLHFAVVRNHVDVVRCLLAAGADMHVRGGNSAAMERGLVMISPAQLSQRWCHADVEAVAMVLDGKICLHCNAKFPPLPLFYAAKACPTCAHVYCRGLCLEHHQCTRNAAGCGLACETEMDTATEERGAAVVVVQPAMRPSPSTWYCTARDCHAVFGLFRKRHQCAICGYSICMKHVESRVVQDRTCFVCTMCTGE
ncbi:Aste57867_12889 [Aphanomyces stellatus]|uniref:Aste57867_12889 protein n=1 Tax=Aphanomyces stellatus TaxID=120398 RepID=A0A485KXF4_9STRA|nr:hypothetical protein As57867_012841 [Aphanomyces stellatus]VFT89736.1 Aste57867_12889 [Aphanomyces stellatus]